MEFERLDQNSEKGLEDSISLTDVIEKYLIHYKWFIFFIIFFIGIAFIKLRYAIPQYSVNGVILIKDKEKGSSYADLSSFEDLGLFGNSDNSLENEIQILKSRRLMKKVVHELKLNFRYFVQNSPYNKEIYPNSPITLNFISDSSSIDNISANFQAFIVSNKSFEFIGNDGEPIGRKSFGENFKVNLGTPESPLLYEISINLNNNFSRDIIGENLIISISSIDNIVNNYMEKLVIEPINEKLSKILTISINESVISKGVALINNLVEQYNADGISDKNQIAQTTIDFLDLRIGLISTELEAIEGTAEQFKTRNKMVDVSSGSDIFLKSSSENEGDIMAANTEKELANYMLTELRNSSSGDLLPGNIGLSDPSILNMISEYNTLILQRNRVLKSSSIINPIIVNIDSQSVVLKSNLESSLRNLISTLEIQISALVNQSGRINSRIASVPKNEREFKEIVRHLETKNSLYLFLLQKREESILSNAVNVNKAKIVDEAYSSGSKVSPKTFSTYLSYLILGVLIPFLFIYVKNLLDTKVHGEQDILSLNIPYVGDIPLTSSKKELFLKEGDNSKVAESFRYLRTNISFMLDNMAMGKTIFVTSTQSKEGKTFTAINLASSLAISGKKVVLIGMDLRAPKITNYLNLDDNNTQGVTNFIKDASIDLEDIIHHYPEIDNLCFINSGDIPPNPVELLMSSRVNFMFDELKRKYEYIIVDTAPVGMVTDTIQISNYSDLTLYVVRANYLDRRMLHIAKKLNLEKKLKNMAIIINGSDHSKGAYGYGYGYGESKKKPWYKM